ncbi:MAG: hypothetical protein ABIF19_05935 [Planctomycetota bacterium]
MKKDLYFIGFLVNVDDSILRFQIGDGFSIDKKQQQEVMPFLQSLDFQYGADSGFEILNFSPNGRASGCYCINKHFPEFAESTPQDGVVIPIAKLKESYRSLRDKLRLLRLFKEGNILLRYSLFYHLKESLPKTAQVLREYPLTDRTVFRLSDDEFTEADAFIRSTRIPFQHPFLCLAFDSFELSYDTYNRGLAFLSLMISMEALFGEQSELTYRISRNVAVLLGKTKDESQEIFEWMKNLYKKRSKFVHGSIDGDVISLKEFKMLRYYVRESIKFIYELDLSRGVLLNILTNSGFGQRPMPKLHIVNRMEE